jgi:hypothetical protein
MANTMGGTAGNTVTWHVGQFSVATTKHLAIVDSLEDSIIIPACESSVDIFNI